MKLRNRHTLIATSAVFGMALLSCAAEPPMGDRNPVSGEIAVQSFRTVCIDGEPSSILQEQYGDYDMHYLGGSNCQIKLGTATPYDQFYQAFRAEIPEGGYKITPVAQGGEGQLSGRNYYTLSRP